jgi:guanosine-3',5'-bis(diphosphate) 3'-pyrophosphohydrolase
LVEIAKRYGVASAEDLLASVGFGRVSPQQILQKIIGREVEEKSIPKVAKKRSRDTKGVVIKGIDNPLVRFSKCCNPVPGDDIVGYITRGRGVSIHRTDCPNIASIASNDGRQIEVSWGTKETGSYPVEIEITAIDRVNLLAKLMNSVTEVNTDIEAVNARKGRDELANIHLVVDIRNLDHMNMVMNRLRQVDGVISVRRANPT